MPIVSARALPLFPLHLLYWQRLVQTHFSFSPRREECFPILLRVLIKHEKNKKQLFLRLCSKIARIPEKVYTFVGKPLVLSTVSFYLLCFLSQGKERFSDLGVDFTGAQCFSFPFMLDGVQNKRAISFFFSVRPLFSIYSTASLA